MGSVFPSCGHLRSALAGWLASDGRILSCVPLSAEFTDPRLVAAYDTLNPYAPGTQPDFYLQLAQEVRARTAIEVGCGTGLVSTHLAHAGIDVIGLDPSARMLALARERPGGDRVRWVLGDVSRLAAYRADMTFIRPRCAVLHHRRGLA